MPVLLRSTEWTPEYSLPFSRALADSGDPRPAVPGVPEGTAADQSAAALCKAEGANRVTHIQYKMYYATFASDRD